MEPALARHDGRKIASAVDASVSRYRRSPAVPVAAAFAAGIFLDHLLEFDLRIWLGGAVVCLAAWGISLQRRLAPLSAVLLLAAIVVAGAGWHHWRWSIVGADHIVRYAEETLQPVRLTGRVVDQPWIVPR